MDYLIGGLAFALIVILLTTIIKFNQSKNSQNKKTKNVTEQIQSKCPVCQSPLFKGENIISKVYRPMNVPDQLCTISGCPHCYPKVEIGLQRNCPVCHKKIGEEGYLVARLFNHTKKGGKHVHVTGCNFCTRHKSLLDN